MENLQGRLESSVAPSRAGANAVHTRRGHDRHGRRGVGGDGFCVGCLRASPRPNPHSAGALIMPTPAASHMSSPVVHRVLCRCRTLKYAWLRRLKKYLHLSQSLLKRIRKLAASLQLPFLLRVQTSVSSSTEGIYHGGLNSIHVILFAV